MSKLTADYMLFPKQDISESNPVRSNIVLQKLHCKPKKLEQTFVHDFKC